MPPLPADSIHARACKLKCEKILTRPSSSVGFSVIEGQPPVHLAEGLNTPPAALVPLLGVAFSCLHCTEKAGRRTAYCGMPS